MLSSVVGASCLGAFVVAAAAAVDRMLDAAAVALGKTMAFVGY